MGVTVSPNDVGQNAIKAGIPGTYTKPKGKDAPDWFTKALDAGNGTFESTSDAAKMLGGSNSWVVSKTEVKITYKQSKKAENPDKYKDKTLDKKSTPWATLTEGGDWFNKKNVNGECTIFWCGVQQKWHMTGPDGLYYRRGTDETSTEEVPNDKWYCCTGYNGGGTETKPTFAVGGVPKATLKKFRGKAGIKDGSTGGKGLLKCERCEGKKDYQDPDPKDDTKRIPCKQCKGTGEVLRGNEKIFTRLKYDYKFNVVLK